MLHLASLRGQKTTLFLASIVPSYTEFKFRLQAQSRKIRFISGAINNSVWNTMIRGERYVIANINRTLIIN